MKLHSNHNLKSLLLILLVGGLGGLLVSCSETDETTMSVDEWNSINGKFFKDKYDLALQEIAKGNSDWAVYKSYTKSDSVDASPNICIVVQKIDSVPGNYVLGNPLQNDTVNVSYKGTLYDGTVFDRSWTGAYNLATMPPVKFSVAGVVDGFSTALQNMHVGDRWLVYIPQELGYGTYGSGSIPGNSTLTFDLTLHSYKHP